jgi:hypothetical protein
MLNLSFIKTGKDVLVITFKLSLLCHSRNDQSGPATSLGIPSHTLNRFVGY